MYFVLHFFFRFFTNTGTDSEVSFSLLSGHHGHRGQQSSTVSASNRQTGLNSARQLIISPGCKPVKIAAISGKPRVQRYLSRECECFFMFVVAKDLWQYRVMEFLLRWWDVGKFDSIFPRMSKLKLWVAKFYKKLAGIGNTFSYFPIYTHFVKIIVLEYCNGHFGVVEICILHQIWSRCSPPTNLLLCKKKFLLPM